MLELKHVYVNVREGIFTSKRKNILTDISFTLPDGDTLGIIGQSGSGKTTIANAIFGLAGCSAGDIVIDEKPVGEYSRLALAKKVQMVTQNPETGFDPDISILHSLFEVMDIHGLKNRRFADDEQLLSLLADVGLEGAALAKLPRYFSGGELQRLSIVRALLVGPKIIIFDEADSMLDTVIRLKLFDTILRLKKKYALSYIYITHDIRVLPHIVKNVLVISNGKTVEYGDVSLLGTSEQPFIRQLRESIQINLDLTLRKGWEIE